MTLRQDSVAADQAAAVAEEQKRLTAVYARLDELRARADTALRDVFASGQAGGTRQARIEREVTAEEQARRVSRLTGVERGLCFGRIDHRGAGPEPGESYYIGRIGLRDEDHEPLLVDWRAPAARPFYAATPGDPGPLVRRRHLHTRDRRVIGLDDEVFDLDALSEGDRGTLVGEAALLASLRRERTGRMGDIVATIQSEQDKVIRSGLHGVLVVQGGPGTGKTVAALHRAAYLLYTHRRALERRGILVIGPNATFLRYIGTVLPSLGETDAVLSGIGELYPGVRATAAESPAASVVKGGLRMAEVIAAAVRDRQRVPDGDLVVRLDDDLTLAVPHAAATAVRDRARGLRLPHNVARKYVVNELLTALSHDQDRRLGRPHDPDDLRYSRPALWEEAPVRAAVDGLWPPLSPRELVAALLSDPDTLRSAAGDRLAPDEQRALLRAPGAEWTVADVPLLDEAAELLGQDDSAERAARRRAERRRAAEEHYAQGVLEFTGLTDVAGLDAATLAERGRVADTATTTAERAAADRQWAYGHVIVDEAQELSAMAWRMVMRRVPTRSMTVVGDVAQTGDPAGARSWAEALDPHVAGRWREQRLLVNYRTPAEIMAVAADVLRAVAPDQRPPESVRHGDAPRAVRIADTRLAAELPALVDAESAAIGAGRLAVLTPGERHAEITGLLAGSASGADPEALDAPVAVRTVTQAKGLEFDAVVVVDPAAILAQSPNGGHDLYVAITRATRRLTVVHSGDLPAALAALTPS